MILSVEAKRDLVECALPKATQVWNYEIWTIFSKYFFGKMESFKSYFILLAVVIAFYDESMQPQQAATIVEKMSQYLKDAGCWEIMFVS